MGWRRGSKPFANEGLIPVKLFQEWLFLMRFIFGVSRLVLLGYHDTPHCQFPPPRRTRSFVVDVA